MTTILINGTDTLLGARIAQIMSEHRQVRLIGLGKNRPIAPVGRADILTATLDNRQIAELLQAKRVDVVVHLDMLGEETSATTHEAALQHNVLETMGLIGACASSGVHRVVMRSSSLVYGFLPSLPSFIREEREIVRSGSPGILRDYRELERFADSFAKKHPSVEMVQLRCAPMAGGGVISPLTSYLSAHTPLTLLGFDPRIQLIHLDDAARAFALAIFSEATSPFNIATDDCLTLTRAIRLAGGQPAPVPEPLFDVASHMGFSPQQHRYPYDRDFLKYACVVDSARAHRLLEWEPTFSAEDTLRELCKSKGKQQNQRSEHHHAEVALHTFLSRDTESTHERR